jgi:transposase
MVMFPGAMQDALEEGHLVFRILDVVEGLDISSVTKKIQTKDPRGTRPYHPRMMLALLMYAYCCGVYSSRGIAAATYDVIPFRVLTADQHPHFTVINEFRLTHLEAFTDLFKQVLEVCGRAGLLDLEHVSLDGSKVEANASKHKAMSHERMKSEIERLGKEIRELSQRAAEVDEKEDALYGKGKEAHEISEELRRRETRLARIEEAKRELEGEARRVREGELRERARQLRARAKDEPDRVEQQRKRTRAEKADAEADRLAAQDDGAGSGGDDDYDGDLPSHRVRTTPAGEPAAKAQRNFTDPDSRIMKRGNNYLQGYNCQIVVDGFHQIIVAEAVTNQAGDHEHLSPLLDRVRQNTGRFPARLSADSGYMSDENVECCDRLGIDAYLAVGREKRGGPNEEGEPQKNTEAWSQMRAKLSTQEGRDTYARRKAIVEPVFGQTKQARRFRRFSLRGLKKVKHEWTLVCLCSNLLKLVNALGNRRLAVPQPS